VTETRSSQGRATSGGEKKRERIWRDPLGSSDATEHVKACLKKKKKKVKWKKGEKEKECKRGMGKVGVKSCLDLRNSREERGLVSFERKSWNPPKVLPAFRKPFPAPLSAQKCRGSSWGKMTFLNHLK